MTAKIIDFHGETTRDIEADKVLEGAIGKLETVVLVGVDDEGQIYLASSTADRARIVLLLALAQADTLDSVEH